MSWSAGVLDTLAVGTARRPVDDLWTEDIVAFRRPGDDAETQLLVAAALRLFGTALETGADPPAELPDPAPDDERPPVPAPAVARLQRILGYRGVTSEPAQRRLLLDWLQLAVERGLRAPHELLPRLLDAGAALQLRELIAEVAGTRGDWLAGFEPRWSWLLPLRHPQESWDAGEGGPAVCTRLVQLDPQSAVELLRTHWKELNAEARAATVAAVDAAGARTAALDLLTTAFADRARSVRDAALVALLRTPESELARRAQQRATAALRSRKRLLRREIEATAPDAGDAAIAAETLDVGHLPTVGERGVALARVVASVPPSLWPGHLQMSIAEIIEWVEGSAWAVALRPGLALAARTWQDEEWAFELLSTRAKRGHNAAVWQLWLHVSTGVIEQLTTSVSDDFWGAFHWWDRPLGPRASALAVMRVARALDTPGRVTAGLNGIHLDLAVLPKLGELRARIDAQPPSPQGRYLANQVIEAHDVLSARQSIRQEFGA